MTPARQADRERVARDLADKLNRMESLEYDGYEELLEAQAKLVMEILASREAAVLEEVERRFACTAGLVQWCKQQATERGT